MGIGIVSTTGAAGPLSLKQKAYEGLRDRILSGALPPGALLSERQLAAELGMSKTPVHAALERLESEGLVTVAPQQGIVVRELSMKGIADHYEIREALEAFVVSRLAGKLTGEREARLRENLAENRRAVRAGDISENIRLDADFHLMLGEFLGNDEISRSMGALRDKIRGVILRISMRHPGRMEASLKEHEGIVAAMVSGDGEGAVSRMAEHLRNGLATIRDEMG